MYVRSCPICQKTSNIPKSHRVPLQESPIEDVPFQSVVIDVCGTNPPAYSSGKKICAHLGLPNDSLARVHCFGKQSCHHPVSHFWVVILSSSILSHPFGNQSCHHPVSPFWESILSSSCLTLFQPLVTSHLMFSNRAISITVFGIVIIIVNSRFLERPQKRSRRNQLIHRCLSKTKLMGSRSGRQRVRRLWWTVLGVETGR